MAHAGSGPRDQERGGERNGSGGSDHRASGDRTPGAASTSSHNLFFALMPDAATGERIARSVAALRAQSPDLGRWLPAERHHITLHFLGHHRPLPDTLVAKACEAAARVRQAPFELVLDRTGGFDRARVGWLGCRAPAAGLLDLHAALREALAQAGVASDSTGPYTPHVTVLRDLRRRLPMMEIDPIPWPVRDFALVDSRHGQRVEYHVIGRWPLG